MRLLAVRTLLKFGGPHIKSLHTHTKHRLQSPSPDPPTSLQCGALFQSLTNSKSVSQGRQLHAYSITSGTLLANAYLATKVAAFYASCGAMASARVVFDGMSQKNSFLWNSMIRGYASYGFPREAVALYREMLGLGRVADNYTFPFVVMGCGDLGDLGMGRKVHGQVVVSGFELDVYVGNALMAMYGKFGEMGLARKVFDMMPHRDLTSWNSLASGYVRNGDPKKGLVVFYSMRDGGLVPDGVSLLGLVSACAELGAVKHGKEIHGYLLRHRYFFVNRLLGNSLIEMYSKCKLMDDARSVFEWMPLRDTVSWNSLIAGYTRKEDAFKSLKTFCLMVLEGSEKPDQVTYTSVLGACNQVTALQFGMSVHAFIFKEGFGLTTAVGTALVDMYAKCGSLACSHHAFCELPEKSLVTWSIMINGYGIHGKGKEAVSLFNEMIGNNISPDDAVLTSVLSACSHAGMVAVGKEIFHRMTREWNMEPAVSHYSCLVDLLGRGGHLDEAYEITINMKVNPTIDILAALLNACRLHRNMELAKVVAEKVFDMKQYQVGSYICLSNIYASEKQWDDVEKIREMVRRKGLTKPPGCSFVELDKIVHRFLVGDKSHKQTEAIYAKLKELNWQLKEIGYKPDTTSVLYNVEEEVKERMLWDHSERLAIGFSLINTGPGTIIRITKNLRVCSDCHTVIKLISKLTCREIVMRDIRRFHHIKDGICSCGDYW